MAAEVANLGNVSHDDLSGHFASLAVIHAAPEWLWAALVAAGILGLQDRRLAHSFAARGGYQGGVGVAGREMARKPHPGQERPSVGFPVALARLAKQKAGIAYHSPPAPGTRGF